MGFCLFLLDFVCFLWVFVGFCWFFCITFFFLPDRFLLDFVCFLSLFFHVLDFVCIIWLKIAIIGLTWGHFSDGDNEVLFIVQ